MKETNFFDDLLNAARSSYSAKDDQKIYIALRKGEYEETLDEMWKIYMVNPAQIIEYKKQVDMIKECGCKVLRNSKGKHKIRI